MVQQWTQELVKNGCFASFVSLIPDLEFECAGIGFTLLGITFVINAYHYW